MTELVMGSLQAYEDAAVDLATDPAKLGAVRARLAARLPACPLFDAARYTRHLETAFKTMVDRQREGLQPADFDVPAMPD
jgi:predicted O-linked N-acetylglucosamine transferase (SPINDLY family)